MTHTRLAAIAARAGVTRVSDGLVAILVLLGVAAGIGALLLS